MSQASEQRPGIHVPARFIPTPTSISPEAQAFLSHPPPFEQTEQPDVYDKAAWRAHAEEANRGLIAYTAMRAQLYPCETITHQPALAPVYEITPKSLSASREDWAILFIHGGGFYMGGGEAAIHSAVNIASLARTRTFSVDYRMPPDHPFPTPLDDCVDAYRWLLSRYKPANIAIYGGSAGANLAPAMLLKARELGLPMAGACVLHSPAADATEAGDSYETNAEIDIVLRRRSPKMMQLYAGDHDRKDPLLSPIFGEYSGSFPPTLLTTGTRDLLLSSTVLLHRAMRRGGVKAELHVWEAMTHAPFFGSPEEAEMMHEHTRFIEEHLGTG